jgi:hypothetical protein
MLRIICCLVWTEALVKDASLSHKAMRRTIWFVDALQHVVERASDGF